MYFDYYYLVIVMPFVLFSFYASYKVNSTYKRYSKVAVAGGMSGAEAAMMVLRQAGIGNVRVERCAGHLTDHFDPRKNTIFLSESVYSGRNAAACGVAAHEAGHAVQHAVSYVPVRIRTALVPVTNFGSKLGIILIMIGVVLVALGEIFVYVAYFGILLFSLTAIFQLVTLPVEFNASHRAMASIHSSGMFARDEEQGARRVLTAAAMTYVAALAVSLAQLLRLLIIVAQASGRRRD